MGKLESASRSIISGEFPEVTLLVDTSVWPLAYRRDSMTSAIDVVSA
jgi:hypothetical protein